VLESGIVPDDWCMGMIKPLFKNKGSKDDPDNYRGITLLSCISKLFTAMINIRLSDYLEGIGAIGSEQIGFRQGYSTMDHIFVLNSIINLYLFKKKQLYCAFIDYKKAFDLVDRSSLWLKLLSNGISGRILKVVRNMYHNAKSCVKLDNVLSESFLCNIGVRQGENLSPLLFSLYLNDFENFIRLKYDGLTFLSENITEYLSDEDTEVFLKLYTLLYADDTVILAESPSELQKALNAVDAYCNEWNMVVNTEKTKIVIFSKGKIKKLPTFSFHGAKLDIEFDFIYLGCTFNYNGRFSKAILKQLSQARCAMFSLITKVRRLNLPVDMQCELFDRLVTPVLLYGCEVWGYENTNKIEIFYRKFLKTLLKVKSSTSNSMIYGELGKHPLKILIEKRILNFWIHLAKGNRNKLSSTFFQLFKKLHDENVYHLPWIKYVHNLLNSYGMSFLWNGFEEYQSKWLSLSLERKILDTSLQNWSSNVNNNILCTNYRIFKTELVMEKYFSLLSYTDYITFAKFRCGNHLLPISKNRYNEGNDRVCKLCNLGEQGDEFHYILVCPYFNDERKLCLKKYYYIRPNAVKLYKLFNTKNVGELKHIVKFIKCINNAF
jgi:hypothetical protein